MNICQELGDQDMFEAYNDYVAPALTQCDDICQKFTYKGSMQETIPETAPILAFLGEHGILFVENHLFPFYHEIFF